MMFFHIVEVNLLTVLLGLGLLIVYTNFCVWCRVWLELMLYIINGEKVVLKESLHFWIGSFIPIFNIVCVLILTFLAVDKYAESLSTKTRKNWFSK